jgi:predicted Zn-dependent protease
LFSSGNAARPSSSRKLEHARSLVKADKNEDARMCLLELLKQDANNHAALWMLGGSYFIDEKYSEAEIVFERLIIREPDAGKFSIALVNTPWKSDRTAEALEEIKRFMSTADAVKGKEAFDQYMKITDSIADDLEPGHN